MSGLGNGGEVKETHKTCVVGKMRKKHELCLLFQQNFEKKLILAKTEKIRKWYREKLKGKNSYYLKWLR